MRLFFLMTLPLFSFMAEKEVVSHIHAQMLIGDFSAAQKSAAEALKFYPESKELRSQQVKILAEMGQEIEAYRAWQKSGERRDDVLEALAWGILQRAETSGQLSIHLSSIIGAGTTQDVRAVHLLVRQMRSSNAQIRTAAVRTATRFGDRILIDELIDMLRRETVWYVRLAIIETLAQFRATEITPMLKEIIGSNRSTIEEKWSAIIGIVSMLDTIDSEELGALLSSPRAGLRQLGIQAILYLDLKEEKHRLVALLDDTSPDVKSLALIALGYLGPAGLSLDLAPLRTSQNPTVAIAAGWLSLFTEKKEGVATLYAHATTGAPETRRLAAAAIGAAGAPGELLARKLMQTTSDPYVRATLARALLGRDKEAAPLIDRFLSKTDEKIMEEGFPGLPFTALAPSTVRHSPDVSQYPRLIDQKTRLSLYNALAILRYDGAIAAIKHFLEKQTEGIPFLAATVLIQEGGGEALDLIEELLTDPNKKIRLQAALVLALSGASDKALPVIESLYPAADREQKLHIIEALGYFASRKSLPFLLERLTEPYSILRIATASAIIQALNH